MPITSSAVRRRRSARLLAAAAAALLTPSLLAPAAGAAPSPPATDTPEPPAGMSTIGGAKLGRPGTQVDPRPGAEAPALPEELTSRSWIVADAESGHVLASHNAHWKLAPASTLKMLFADTLLPKFDKNTEHTVKRSDLEGMGSGSSLVGIKEGLSYTVEDLWNGVFLRSGNDAVHVLCAMNGGKAKTVREMNAHAEKLRALDTNAVSPDGYDKPGQVSSAYDLTLIARSGMQKKDFRDYASTVRTDFPGKPKEDGEKKNSDGDGKPSDADSSGNEGTRQPDKAEQDKAEPDKKKQDREYYEIQNTNRLLTGDSGLEPYPGIAGVKNGYTSNAGNTFTGVAERNGRVLLVTVMHPEKSGQLEVYKETARLFDWGFQAADKVRPVGELVRPGEDVGQGATGGPGENAGGGQNPDQAQGPAVSAGAESAGASGGGMGVALGIVGGCLVVLTAVAYGVHRRWPMALPDLSRLWHRRSAD